MTTVHHAPRGQQHHSISPGDLDMLSLLTGENPSSSSALGNHSNQQPASTNRRKKSQADRRPPVDPLMVAAAASAAGPDNTRNHYLHSFFPQSLAYSSCDGERLPQTTPTRPKMESRQAPRHIRLLVEEEEKKRKQLADKLKQEELEKKRAEKQAQEEEDKRRITAQKQKDEQERSQIVEPTPRKTQVKSLREEALAKLLRQPSTPPLLEKSIDFSPPLAPGGTTAPSAVRPEESVSSLSLPSQSIPPSSLPPLEVQCRVRTRIPTPHGHIFLHLYTNNHDDKEHMAFVADHAQMASTSVTTNAVEGSPILTRSETSNRPLPFIRSRSLDSKWHKDETDQERIIRGAYVGRLSANSQIASTALAPLADYLSTPPSPSASVSDLPPPAAANSAEDSTTSIDPPLVRIHSECFTGETIGSQRCDCGEQLDEAFRLITSAGRGVVVYLRQEGRGIGLLEKMRAYNLQDLGHDTVTANLMLGHGADMRTYGIAGAILRDLGIAGEDGGRGGVRLLTNNPDKITQIEKEGVRVAERVAMVPRSWILAEREEARRRRHRNHHQHHLGGGSRSKKSSSSRRQHGSTRRSKRTTTDTLESSVTSLPSTVDFTTGEDQPSSVPLSVDPSRSPSPSRNSASVSDDEDYSSSFSESSGDDDEDGRSESSTQYNLRHSGVGMIGRSTTASPELEKYLRTKIERMGHMLVAPPSSSSTASSVAGGEGGRSRRTTSAHPLSESTTSLSDR
ncbi:hypothetical protein JCM3765_005617 [Sporobolomyces pararoseus]